MSQTIGDFRVKVGATVDQASFNKGVSEVDRVAKSVSGLVKAAAAATATTKLLKTAFDLTAESRMARQIGISTQNLDKWKTAANIAGVSANGLVASMSNLENKMQHLKMGQVDMGMAKGLGMLGIGYGDFADMNPEQRMAAVFNQADQMKDQQLAATLVGDILGQAGLDYYNSLKLSGKSLSQQLAEAKSLNFVSDRNRQSAARFAAEMKSVQSAGASIAKLLGAEIAEQLTPTVNKIKNMLITNRNAIIRGVQGVAKTAGSLVNGIVGIVEKVGPMVGGLIDKFGGLDKVLIKVGLGFASWKLYQVAGSVRSIVSAIGGLKGMLSGGLKGVGLFLVLEDIMYYFAGGGSVLGDVLEWFDKFKKEFALDENFDSMTSSLKKLTEAIVKLLKSMKFDVIGNFWDAIKKGFETLLGGSANAAMIMLKDWADIMTDIVEGDWKKLGSDAKTLLKDSYEYSLLNTLTNSSKKNQTVIKERGLELLKQKYDQDQGQRAGDGIISPNGRLTQVAPDDWVVAFKNVGDLASAFVPQGTNVSAPASINIQQTFNVEGGRDIPAVIKAQAYRGTSEALQQNVKNATRILQLMPGTK